MALAYLLLLLGSAVAFPDWKIARSEKACKDYFFPRAFAEDDEIENCLTHPGIAASVGGYAGADVDEKIEVTLQCKMPFFGMFTDDVLEPDTLKQFLETKAKEEPYGESITLGLDACFSTLQKPVLVLPFLRCIGEYC